MGVYLGNECVSVSSGIPSSSGLPDNLEELMNQIEKNGTKVTDMSTGGKGLGYYSITVKVVPDSSYADNPFILQGAVIKLENAQPITAHLTPVYFLEAGDYIYGEVTIYTAGRISVGGTLMGETWEFLFESYSSTCYYLPFSS